MKERLLIASVAGVGFLAGLAIAGVRAGLWQPHTHLEAAAAPLQPMPVAPVMSAPAADAGTEPQVASEPSAGDGPPDADEGGASLPAPTYEDQAAAHDRAAAHSARSR